MPRRSTQSELFNVCDRLHNLDEDAVIEFRANYLFMKQAPMYVSLEKKYKETKKKNRELKRMVDLLNRQNMELMERIAGQRYGAVSDTTTTECSLSDRFAQLSIVPSVDTKPDEEVVLVPVKSENIVYEIIEEEVVEQKEEVVVEEEEEVVVEEEEEVVVEEEETEEVFEEEEEVVVEEEEETEEVVVEEEETEEIVVEETEEVVVEEEEEETEEVVEEEEETEEGVYEITINGTRYYVSNETDSIIYSVAEDDDIGEEVGQFVNGVAKINS